MLASGAIDWNWFGMALFFSTTCKFEEIFGAQFNPLIFTIFVGVFGDFTIHLFNRPYNCAPSFREFEVPKIHQHYPQTLHSISWLGAL